MKEKNAVLLLFLSAYRPGQEKLTYYYMGDGKGSFEGIQTDDAPTQCLLEKAQEDGNGINKILCITSWMVYTQEAEDGKTQFQLYCEKVEEYCGKKPGYGEKIEIIPIFYDFTEETLELVAGKEHCLPLEPSEKYKKETLLEKEEVKPSFLENTDVRAMHIYKQLSDKLAGLGDSEIYVDYTGGFRDISFLMTTVIRYLEFKNVRCRRIVYSQFNKGGTNYIHDIQYIYEMYQMINGVSEFVTTGSARQLNQAFGQNRGMERSPEAEAVLQNMRRFADVISLCEVAKIKEAVEQVADSLDKLEKAQAEDDLMAEMLKSLLPLIREKLYVEQEAISYPQLIRWCAENWLLQQAVTIYVEKMPVYYLERTDFKNLIPKYIDCSDNKGQSSGTRGKTEESAIFYTNIYDGFLEGELACKLKKTLNRLLKKSMPKNSRKPEDRHFDPFRKALEAECREKKFPEQQAALEQLCRFMKEWRESPPNKIYPELFTAIYFAI